jgi:hypothetical protein
VCNEDIELARFKIARLRLLLDDAINAIEGVIKSLNIEEEPTNTEENGSYPSMAYFIVYTPTDNCNDNTFFTGYITKI